MIPYFELKSIIHKGKGTKKFIIINNRKMGHYGTYYTLKEKETGRTVKRLYTPKELWVLGYREIRKPKRKRTKWPKR